MPTTGGMARGGLFRMCLTFRAALLLLLCTAASVSCRTLTSDYGAGFDGRPSTRTRSSSGLSLLDVQGKDHYNFTCETKCNGKKSEGEECFGDFGMFCRDLSEIEGENIVGLSKLSCIGFWSGFALLTGNFEMISSKCDGFYTSTSLYHASAGHVTTIDIHHYGCSHAYEKTNKVTWNSSECSYSCRGSDIKRERTIYELEDGNETDHAISLSYLEELMNEFSEDSDPFCFEISQYDNSTEVDMGSAMNSVQNISIECNGKESKFDTQCIGNFRLDKEYKNKAVFEKCVGMWEPIEKTNFTCAGLLVLEERGDLNNFNSLSICQGNAVFGGLVQKHHKHVITEDAKVCFGFSSYTEQDFTRQVVKPSSPRHMDYGKMSFA